MTSWQWEWTEVDAFRRHLWVKNDIGVKSNLFQNAVLFGGKYVSHQYPQSETFTFSFPYFSYWEESCG